MALTLISDLNIDLRSAQEEFKKSTDVKADKIVTFFGELTEVSGDVDVEGRNSYVWFKQMGSSHPVQILNREVSPTPGLPVIVGNRPPSEELEVLEIDTSLLEDLDIGLKSIVAHSSEHLPGGGDMLWVDPRQISEFAVYPAAGLSISVSSGYYNYGNQTVRFPGLTSIDISGSQPLATQHIAVGVYLDLTTNTIGTVDGTAVLLGARLVLPTWPTNSAPLAIIDLDGSQTTISFANDIISAKGSFSDSIWSRRSSGDVYYDDGNVAIDANTQPLGKLQIGPGTSAPIAGTSSLHIIDVATAQLTIREENTDTELLAGVVSGYAFVGSSSNHPMLFLTGNTSKMGIDHATGNVSIGKLFTSAADQRLEVLTTAGAQLRLTHTDNSKFVDFELDTNHDLTIKPSSIGQIKLQPTTDSIDFFQVLDADGGAPVLNVNTVGEQVSIGTTDASFIGQGSVTQNAGLFIENPDAANFHGFTLRKISDSRFTVNSMLRARAGSTTVQDGDFLGGVQFWGHDGTDYNRSSAINAVVDGAVSANTMPGALLFYTTPTNSPTERMRIAPNGDVAIGTDEALAQLHIDQSGSAIAQPVLYLDQADVSEEMIQFETTIGIGNAIEAVGAKALTVTHFIKVTLPGALTRYIPVGTIA